MPTVRLPDSTCRQFTGGVSEVEVEASNFGRLIVELERRFPGIGKQIEDGMAVAIDGEIYQDCYAAPLRAESEIVLIPKIGGG